MGTLGRLQVDGCPGGELDDGTRNLGDCFRNEADDACGKEDDIQRRRLRCGVEVSDERQKHFLRNALFSQIGRVSVDKAAISGAGSPLEDDNRSLQRIRLAANSIYTASKQDKWSLSLARWFSQTEAFAVLTSSTNVGPFCVKVQNR